MREIYFDNSATTRVSERVMELVVRTMREDYGNPSAKHSMGVRAERYVREAAERIARTLKVSAKEILFTSGGTESDNMALIGCALANQRAGRHIITTAIEHPAVYEPLLFLEGLGFEVTVLPVDERGHISPAQLKEALREDTILVSVMYVNNEIGAVEPVQELAGLVHERKPAALFHVDAIQGYGKYRIYPKRLGIDLLSVSGHKLHAPKGVGFLYIDSRVKIRPLLYGGGQQGGLRSGTINVPGIAGLGEAAVEAYEDFDEKITHMRALKDRITDAMLALPGVSVNSGRGEEGAPHIVSISVEDVRAEVLLHALEERGIYVSSGSACSSNHPGISGTLKGIGLRDKLLDATIRVSLCDTNTAEEADAFAEAMAELVPTLRRFTRR
ncbi:cysteine desulfurase [Fusobacterium naviforme]|nr:cysteine desulfurase [Fusobacterium naviforme]PSL09336.1 cysteine desulfurase [Fusobacterium naviforme]STO27973.1 Cysteine desulfurase [Fusobacterium naviforme]